jgi:hypothetical protein
MIYRTASKLRWQTLITLGWTYVYYDGTLIKMTRRLKGRQKRIVVFLLQSKSHCTSNV